MATQLGAKVTSFPTATPFRLRALAQINRVRKKITLAIGWVLGRKKDDVSSKAKV